MEFLLSFAKVWVKKTKNPVQNQVLTSVHQYV